MKSAPTMPKVASAVKSKPTPPDLPKPDPPELPKLAPPELPSGTSQATPPPPKGVSASAPPPKVDYTVDKYEYFDMAIAGLPNHSLLVPRNVEAKQEVRISVPNAMQVVPLVPMLGSEFKGMEGVSLQKVPTNVKAVRSLPGLLRGFMSKELESKTDFHGYARLDDVKRELLTGRFHKEVSSWSVETFMSIAAFDEKDRFELLTAVDIKHSASLQKRCLSRSAVSRGIRKNF